MTGAERARHILIKTQNNATGLAALKVVGKQQSINKTKTKGPFIEVKRFNMNEIPTQYSPQRHELVIQ